MNTRFHRPPQRGFTMITILLMMVVLAALALSGMTSSVVQEHMAGNARDHNLALQAAESALRDAEADIEANLGLDSPFKADCTGGLCVPPSMASSAPTSNPLWKTIDWSTGKSRAYGSATNAPALPGLASQPRYIIEQLPVLPPTTGLSANLGSAGEVPPQAFRITARATGQRATTVVILQATYIKQ